MHFDAYVSGAPYADQHKKHRLKFFINLDTEPRRWNTSLTLPEALKFSANKFHEPIANDLNIVCAATHEFGCLEGAGVHTLGYPTLSCVIGNAEAISHAVLYRRRMIAGEFMIETRDMLDPKKSTHAQLGSWLDAAGIEIRKPT